MKNKDLWHPGYQVPSKWLKSYDALLKILIIPDSLENIGLKLIRKDTHSDRLQYSIWEKMEDKMKLTSHTYQAKLPYIVKRLHASNSKYVCA